jgi:hypothetical protein
MDQSLEMAKPMMDCGKKVQLQLVKGGEHTLKKDHKGWIKAWEHTKKFLAEHLKQMPPAKAAMPPCSKKPSTRKNQAVYFKGARPL